MIDISKLYQEKRKDLDGALVFFESGDFIITSLGGGEPIPLLNRLHEITERGVKDCQLSNTLPMGNYEFIANPDYQDAIFTSGWFYSPQLRKAHLNRNVSYVPQNLHQAYYKRTFAMEDRRQVLLVACSPMDEHGYLSMSLGCTYEREAINNGAHVIAVVNPKMARTFGDTMLHISEVDVLVENDYLIPALPDVPLNEKDRKIGAYIAEYIEDGSTIQLGIGGIPNAVAEGLKGKKDLGIHTEMFTDGMVDLIQSGAVNNRKKTLYNGQSVCTFALGSQKLYDFLDNNPSVIFKSGNWTNNPYIVGQNHKMVSINTTLEVDLFGQCASESIGLRQFSGTGGQSDTAIGAQICKEGKSFIALYSTANIKDENGELKKISKIVPWLKPGAAVSLSRNEVDYVVTEYGVAWLRGQSIRERVKRLIAIAHPDFREELEKQAFENMIW